MLQRECEQARLTNSLGRTTWRSADRVTSAGLGFRRMNKSLSSKAPRLISEFEVSSPAHHRR